MILAIHKAKEELRKMEEKRLKIQMGLRLMLNYYETLSTKKIQRRKQKTFKS